MFFDRDHRRRELARVHIVILGHTLGANQLTKVLGTNGVSLSLQGLGTARARAAAGAEQGSPCLTVCQAWRVLGNVVAPQPMFSGVPAQPESLDSQMP